MAGEIDIKNMDFGTGELSPGTVGYRHEPKGGLKHRMERIRNESKHSGSLPFTFSKPKRDKRNKKVKCIKCGNVVFVPENTVGMVCSKCKKYVAVVGV